MELNVDINTNNFNPYLANVYVFDIHFCNRVCYWAYLLCYI